jgi:hypothetical protein
MDLQAYSPWQTNSTNYSSRQTSSTIRPPGLEIKIEGAVVKKEEDFSANQLYNSPPELEIKIEGAVVKKEEDGNI